ncbi:MAG: hypothetical protein ACJAVK_001009 [Akkermansiaceae bacterium]|jgi:hypothetical protein
MFRLSFFTFFSSVAVFLGGCHRETSEFLEIERTDLGDGVVVEFVSYQGVQWHSDHDGPAKGQTINSPRG